MLCGSELSGWAGQILESLSESGTTTGSVVTWLRGNIGTLNTYLKTSYINSGDCITPDFDMASSGVYTEMYYCYYLSRKASYSLGAMSFDWQEIRGEEQGSIKRVSNNERAKTYRQLAKDCDERLKKLIDWYNYDNNSPAPSQVLYNQRAGVADSGLRDPGYYYPPANYYSEYNFIWI